MSFLTPVRALAVPVVLPMPVLPFLPKHLP